MSTPIKPRLGSSPQVNTAVAGPTIGPYSKFGIQVLDGQHGPVISIQNSLLVAVQVVLSGRRVRSVYKALGTGIIRRTGLKFGLPIDIIQR